MDSQLTPDHQDDAEYEGAETFDFQEEIAAEAEEAPALEAHEPYESPALEDQTVEQPLPAGGGFLSFAVSATGFCMVAGGAALAVGPRFSWQAQKTVNELSGMGVEAGAFLAGGVVLFFLGWVLRAVRAPRPAAATVDHGDDFEAFTEAFEELATDLAMFRESILQVATNVEQYGQQQAAFQEQLRTEIQSQAPDPDEGAKTGQNEAMFRLAASLDQLNARVDERIHHMDAQLRGQFQTMGNTIAANRADLDVRLNALASQIQAIEIPALTPPEPAPAPAPVEQAPALEPVVDEFEDRIEEFDLEEEPQEELEILVELEDPESQEETIESFEVHEAVESLIANEPEPPAPPPAPPTLDFDALDVCEPTPTTAPEPPAVRPEEAPPAEVESALDSLLPDESIQNALDRDRQDND